MKKKNIVVVLVLLVFLPLIAYTGSKVIEWKGRYDNMYYIATHSHSGVAGGVANEYFANFCRWTFVLIIEIVCLAILLYSVKKWKPK